MGKIAVVVFTSKVKERYRPDQFFDSFAFMGLRSVLAELPAGWTVEHVAPERIDEYDFALISVTSNFDVLNLAAAIPRERRRVKVIIGGQGVLNVKAYLPWFDVAVFGRAEGQIDDILSGARLPNVYRRAEDPELAGSYEYRQPAYLVPGEKNVGCPFKCYFCNYGWTHRQFKADPNFRSTTDDGQFPGSHEDDLRALKVEDGRHYISAIDGVTEASRFFVNKRISNADIIAKYQELGRMEFKLKTLRPGRRISLKLYVICGYPWEVPGPEYLDELRETFRAAAVPGGNLIYTFLAFTPFSPEPLTPLEDLRADLLTDWRRVLLRSGTFLQEAANLKIYVSPAINSHYTLFERVFLNRAEIRDGRFFEKVLLDPRFRALPVFKKMVYLSREGYLERFAGPGGSKDCRPWSYLRGPFILDGLKERVSMDLASMISGLYTTAGSAGPALATSREEVCLKSH